MVGSPFHVAATRADHAGSEERPCEERRATIVQLTSRHRSSADEAGSRAGGGAGKPQGPAGEGARGRQ